MQFSFKKHSPTVPDTGAGGIVTYKLSWLRERKGQSKHWDLHQLFLLMANWEFYIREAGKESRQSCPLKNALKQLSVSHQNALYVCGYP